MANFLDNFPKIGYDINKRLYGNYDLVTNITFRVNIIRSILNNVSTYYDYEIEEGETPEILADRIYNDPFAYWIILYANDIVDPQYDWPLGYAAFKNYITDKYGSLTGAGTQIHHYEKVVERIDNLTGKTEIERYIVPYENLLEATDIEIPLNSFYDGDLPAAGEYTTINIAGKTISQRVYRNAVSALEYETQLNDSKRLIKVIKPEYYPQIIKEFKKMTGSVDPMIRKLR